MSIVKGEKITKDKIIIFVVGIILGAILSTGAIILYTNSTNNNNNNQITQNPGGTPPEMPQGQNQDGNPPAKPGESSNQDSNTSNENNN